MRILLICLLLTGCAAFDPEPYNIKHPVSVVTIEVVPQLVRFDHNGNLVDVMGTATRSGDKCHIKLREYPLCLAHEMRHCIEGQWHPPMVANDDDCYQDGMLGQ